MIGADGALFDKPISNLFQFDLGEGERVQLLISLEPNNGIPA